MRPIRITSVSSEELTHFGLGFGLSAWVTTSAFWSLSLLPATRQAAGRGGRTTGRITNDGGGQQRVGVDLVLDAREFSRGWSADFVRIHGTDSRVDDNRDGLGEYDCRTSIASTSCPSVDAAEINERWQVVARVGVRLRATDRSLHHPRRRAGAKSTAGAVLEGNHRDECRSGRRRSTRSTCGSTTAGRSASVDLVLFVDVLNVYGGIEPSRPKSSIFSTAGKISDDEEALRAARADYSSTPRVNDVSARQGTVR